MAQLGKDKKKGRYTWVNAGLMLVLTPRPHVYLYNAKVAIINHGEQQHCQSTSCIVSLSHNALFNALFREVLLSNMPYTASSDLPFLDTMPTNVPLR